MTCTIKITKNVESEVELPIPSYWKSTGKHFAVFDRNNIVTVFSLDSGLAIINHFKGNDYTDGAIWEIQSCSPCTADEFNNALFQVTSNLIPIPDKEVYELEKAEDELNINMELLEAMRSDVVNEVPIEIYEPSANATL